MATALDDLAGPGQHEQRNRGGSDDIGHDSWTVPTLFLRYPSHIRGRPGHNWANAVTVATPIAHKCVVAGAKVVGMTVIDLLTRPELVDQAWKYFREVQTKDTKYQPLISPADKPPTYLNKRIMDSYREQMRKFYYDPSKYDTYLDQLGIKYPTTRP